jgi:folate-binding protein YgfZ
MSYYSLDHSRGFIMLKGEESKQFLQGLITNNMEKVTPENSIYTALLTPQGKYLFDFFVSETNDGLLLDIAYQRVPELVSLLTRYKLRANVEISSYAEPQTIGCAFGDDALEKLALLPVPGFRAHGAYVDPRMRELGARVTMPCSILEEKGFHQVDWSAFSKHRLSLGVPENGTDLIVDKSIPLECGFDELNAISWDKGCYLGQELTARTKHRGLVRKRLLPVIIKGSPIPPMTPLMFNGNEMGSMRSSTGDKGLALIRLEVLEQLGDHGFLTANESELTPRVQPWMKFQV